VRIVYSFLLNVQMKTVMSKLKEMILKIIWEFVIFVRFFVNIVTRCYRLSMFRYH